jgi:hypothetical protein
MRLLSLPRHFDVRNSASCAACILLLIIHALLALHSVHQHSPTVDEGIHLLSGLLAWEKGRFDVYCVNPPLVKLLTSLPIVASTPTLPENARVLDKGESWIRMHDGFMRANQGRYQMMVVRARCVGVALSVVGGCIVYLWSRQLFGVEAGVIAVALWALCPNVLCWAGVCTVDMGAAVFGVAALNVLRRYLRKPGWLAAIWVGVFLGLATLSKFTLLILYPLYAAIGLVAGVQSRPSHVCVPTVVRRLQLCLAIIVSVVVVNLGYGVHGTCNPLGAFSFRSEAFSEVTGDTWVHDSWLRFLRVPLPEEFVTGLDKQMSYGDIHRPDYLRGQWKRGGWWYYYLYALSVKLPIGTMMLLCTACALMLWKSDYRCSSVDELLVWLPVVTIMILVSLQTGINGHLRYLLPTFPLLCIGASRVGLLMVWKNGPCYLNWARCACGTSVVVVALCVNAVSIIRTHPHYMSYFNAFGGGPDKGWEHLLGSNFDWGQDLLFLKSWMDEHPDARPLQLAYYGGIDPHVVGVDYQIPRCQVFGEITRPEPGWYAISANFVCGAGFMAYDEKGKIVYFSPGAFARFCRLSPIAKAGYSIFIYHITRDPETHRFGVSNSALFRNDEG